MKFLKQADKVLTKRMLEKLELLSKEPVTRDTKLIEGYKEKLFRVRVGDYRILYEIDHANKKTGVVKIDKRSKVYQIWQRFKSHLCYEVMHQLYVVTGGPSTGKTSALDYLAKKGFYVIPEAARVIIDEDMAKGRSLTEIRADEIAFQRRALKMKIEVENNAPRNRVVFLDRGIPDSVPYLQICGVDVRDEVKQILGDRRRYRKVFLMEHIGFKGDYARTEDEDKSRLLSRLLKEVYQELGYDVVDIPPLPAESVEVSIMQRGEFILKSL